jgi:hypothetical protein
MRKRPLTASVAELNGDVPTIIVYRRMPSVHTSAAAWSNSPPAQTRAVQNAARSAAIPAPTCSVPRRISGEA